MWILFNRIQGFFHWVKITPHFVSNKTYNELFSLFSCSLKLNSTSRKDRKLKSLLLQYLSSIGFHHLAVRHWGTFSEVMYFLLRESLRDVIRNWVLLCWNSLRPEKLRALFKHNWRIVCQGLQDILSILFFLRNCYRFAYLLIIFIWSCLN